jgi:hypothetical protein
LTAAKMNSTLELNPGGPLPILLGTDVPLRFSKHPPIHIFNIFENHTHSYIFPSEFLKSTGLTRKTGEYFQCPVYFGISLVERTSKINGQIRT